jgi:hypothetical protein
VKVRGAYSRKVSSQEAREGYFLVLKNKLQLFPPLGKKFDLVQNDAVGKARVESYRCTCRGPDLPHEHYFIRWKGLRPKDRVEIREDPERQGRYVVQIRR